MELNGCYRTKVHYKTFAIPILTAPAFIMFDMLAARIGIANALELTFVLWQPLSSIPFSICTFLIFNFFA